MVRRSIRGFYLSCHFVLRVEVARGAAFEEVEGPAGRLFIEYGRDGGEHLNQEVAEQSPAIESAIVGTDND